MNAGKTAMLAASAFDPFLDQLIGAALVSAVPSRDVTIPSGAMRSHLRCHDEHGFALTRLPLIVNPESSVGHIAFKLFFGEKLHQG